MKIELIIPYVLTEDWIMMAVNRYVPFAHSSTELHGVDLSDAAPKEVTAENTPQLVVERALRAQEEGADACIVDCFYEAGLEESRAVLKIPIIGAGEAAMLFAYGLRAPFAVLTSDQEGIAVVPEHARRYGFDSRLHSVVSIDLPWQEIPERPEEALSKMEEEALMLDSTVQTVVIGCTDLAAMSRPLQDNLMAKNRDIKVVNPIAAAIGLAEMRVALGT